MIGLDTNVIVRYLAQDDPVQSARATQIIERQLTEEEPGFVSLVAMVETVWVLQRVYGLTSREAANAVERMLEADTLMIQNEQEVFMAMMALKSGAGAFSDALIGALGGWAGCKATAIFDRKAARLDGFEPA
jgi:predicted nucleic-acid-binding protein